MTDIKVYREPGKATLDDWITGARITGTAPQFYPVVFVNPGGLPEVAVFLTKNDATEFEHHLRDLYGWRVAPSRADVFTTYGEAVDGIVGAWGPSNDDDDPYIEEDNGALEARGL